MKTTVSHGTLRVIGGRWRSRKLNFPAVDQLRPTANRIRETLFNWLQDVIPGAVCLDLFAGSGACGIEALSRGARQVTFVERNPLAADAIARNLTTLGALEATVVRADVLAWLKIAPLAPGSVGVVFVDPPYAARLERACCEALEKSGLLTQRALIYLESDRAIGDDLIPVNWRIRKSKRAGAVHYALLAREPGPNGRHPEKQDDEPSTTSAPG
jgi:16S rRNA (guanine966-N2)-methyltransferase